MRSADPEAGAYQLAPDGKRHEEITRLVSSGKPHRFEPGEEVVGGLHVVGTERHEARRIDNQLRGRSGRQGDPGSSRFFLSLRDELLAVFAGEWTLKVLGWLGLKEGVAIEDRRISKGIEKAQKRVEEKNFLIRKRLLEYDEVMDTQRKIFYQQRQALLEGREIEGLIWQLIDDSVDDAVSSPARPGLPRAVHRGVGQIGLRRERRSEGSPGDGLHRGQRPASLASQGRSVAEHRRDHRRIHGGRGRPEDLGHPRAGELGDEPVRREPVRHANPEDDARRGAGAPGRGGAQKAGHVRLRPDHAVPRSGLPHPPGHRVGVQEVRHQDRPGEASRPGDSRGVRVGQDGCPRALHPPRNRIPRPLRAPRQRRPDQHRRPPTPRTSSSNGPITSIC